MATREIAAHYVPEGEFVIDDPAVLKTLFDPLRYRLFRALAKPRSVREVGAQLGMSPNRLYYHVRMLERSGLIRAVDARVDGNHTERLYAVTASKISVAPDLRESVHLDPAQALGVLQEIFDELADAHRAESDGEFGVLERDYVSNARWGVGRLTLAQARKLDRRLEALFDEFAATPTRERGSLQYGLLLMVTPLPERAKRARRR